MTPRARVGLGRLRVENETRPIREVATRTYFGGTSVGGPRGHISERRGADMPAAERSKPVNSLWTGKMPFRVVLVVVVVVVVLETAVARVHGSFACE